MIELQLSSPIGPDNHLVDVLKIRTELNGLDAATVLDCGAADGSINESLLAIHLGRRLTNRPEVEIKSLSGEDATTLAAVCYQLAGAMLSAPRTPATVRAPKLGELAEAEGQGGMAMIQMAAICSGMDYDALCEAPAAVFLGINDAVIAAKKGGLKTAKALADLQRLLNPASPEPEQSQSN
jgi:hypothetical protein